MSNSKCKFIVLSTQRSGSTAFRLLLNSHPKVRCHDEVFLKTSNSPDAIAAYVKAQNLQDKYKRYDNHKPSKYQRWRLYRHVNNNSLVHANNEWTENLLEDFIDSLLNRPNHPAPWTSPENWNEHHINDTYNTEEAVGFKVMYYELENQYLIDRVMSGEFKIIHLIRKNKLEKIVSTRLANERKTWHATKSGDSTRIELNPERVIFHIKRLEAEEAGIREFLKPTGAYECYYEDFRVNPEATGHKALDYLGVERSGLVCPIQKLSGHMQETIINYTEICRALKESGYSHFLNE